jgi:predicted AAA+ superfamily ATPase
MIKRVIHDSLLSRLQSSHKVFVLYGARQLGKTTLLRALEAERPYQALWLNGDEPHLRAALLNPSTNCRIG